MKKQIKLLSILLSLIVTFVLFLTCTSTNVHAAEITPYETPVKLNALQASGSTSNSTYPFTKNSDETMDEYIRREIDYLIDSHAIPSWHRYYYYDEGYQAFYYKMVHLSYDGLDGYYYWKSLSQDKLLTYSSWYKNDQDETWDYIIKNLDIDPEYLEPNAYLGLYWDSYAYDKKENANLYLIWTSKYLPSEFVNITQIKESNKVYNLYDSQKDMDDLKSNWWDSSYYHFKDNDLTLWITPIAGIDDGKSFGLPIKQSYNFQGFTFGIDKGQFSHDADPNHYFDGKVEGEMQFDLGATPQNDGHNIMKLCTHAYEYITDIEAQSYYDLGFGGYMHMVHFNLSINPDKIYRVDVKYTISNDNKDWYQFWLPDDSHTIMKSLSPDKSRGGFLGLFNYQGFKQGSFSSVNNPNRQFKYELLLDYDDQGWRWKIFTGQEYKESDYRKINEFKILRINYLLDEKVYDVAIKMDTIEGETYNIFSPELIEDEASAQHQVKTWVNDVVETVKDKFNTYKTWIWVALGAIGLIIILYVVLKVRRLFHTFMTPPNYYNQNYPPEYYYPPKDDRNRRKRKR